MVQRGFHRVFRSGCTPAPRGVSCPRVAAYLFLSITRLLFILFCDKAAKAQGVCREMADRLLELQATKVCFP